jgi:starch synthase
MAPRNSRTKKTSEESPETPAKAPPGTRKPASAPRPAPLPSKSRSKQQSTARSAAALDTLAPKRAKRVGSTTRAPQRPSGLDIVMVASEAVPFSKTGGLADVTTALSKVLGRMGHSVTLITPRYRGAPGGEPRGSVRTFLAGVWLEATFLEVPLGENAKAILVDCPPLYDRAGLYHEHTIDYPDNPARFAFLSLAALDWASTRQPLPSVIHTHDWQTSLMPVYARQYFSAARFAVVTTIHNLAFQGWFHKGWVTSLGLSWRDFTVDGFEFYDQLCFLKAGVNFSDALTTVSPTYAQEIQTPEYGHGFDGIIRARRHLLTGILNGIDTDVWNPATDKYLPAPFTPDDLHGKALAKRALLEEFRLATDDAAADRPVIGIVSRMAEQKGLDLLEAVARDLPTLDATFVVVGTGDPRYEHMWRQLAAEHPDRIGAFIGFDERLAHLVEGGADIFLMPSRFEPCGLNQMYSMRYGTIPVVRAVGGLADTVRPYNSRNGQGTGFLFGPYQPAAMIAAVRDALGAYRQQRAWRRLQTNGMRQDFSWERSAAEYVKVYKGVMASRRNT